MTTYARTTTHAARGSAPDRSAGAHRPYMEQLADAAGAATYWRTIAILLAVAAVVQAVAWPLVYVSIPKKWFYHSGPGLMSQGPSADACVNVATNAVLPVLATNSGSVRTDMQTARQWMTDEAVARFERALAGFERKYKVPYEDYVESQGVGTAFDELKTAVEDPIGSGASRRYPVLVTGVRTTLSKKHEPLGSTPFAVRVYLAPVAPDEANPLGLLMSSFEPVDTAGQGNDLPPILGKEDAQ